MSIRRRTARLSYAFNFLSVLLLASCGRAASTPVAAPTQPSEPLAQWATAASSNIELDDADGSNSGRAVGVSLSSDPCDLSSSAAYAWTSDGSDSWLEVYFDTAVIPSELTVVQSVHPNQVTKIELIDLRGEYHEVYSAAPAREQCPFDLTVDASAVDQDVIGAKISIDDSGYGRAAIDAVRLVGQPSGSTNTYGTPTPLPGTPAAIPAAIGERSIADRPDDFPGLYQIHVVYLLFRDQDDLKRDLDGSMAASIDLANAWFKEQTGGSTLRFDTYQGELDVTFAEFGITKAQFLENIQALYDRDHKLNPRIALEDYYLYWVEQKAADLGLNARGKYYIVYTELRHSFACGQSNLSDHLGIFYLQTQRCGYGRMGVDKYAWENEFVVVHEFLHGIGFVSACGKNAENYHVTDSSKDLMYGYAGSGEVNVIDVGNDDYFNHDIPNCPDLADSAFLEPLPANARPPSSWPPEYRLP
ncbi:MAG TPA: hypothetical protein VGJ22_09025 [Anaerolineales bacterium]|jgi:hypothetical protein